MSGSPGQFRPRELEIVRVLLDKHLLERAVNLAEARWTGSGEMVRLAYRWQELNPAERRAELERIGPEQLAQFRPLAGLDPDLAAVLTTLEQRGVLPASLIVDEVQDHPVQTPRVEPAPQATAPVDDRSSPSPPDAPSRPEAESEVAVVDKLLERIENMSEEALTAGGYGAVAAEIAQQVGSEQRADAVRRGEELLERVRARLETSARRTTSNQIGTQPPTAKISTLSPSRWTPQSYDQSTTLIDDRAPFSPPPDYWINRVCDEQVIVINPGAEAPSDDQLVALANEFDLEMSEFVLEPGSTRALFGGLKRSGQAVDVELGPLSTALTKAQLVVIRGRLYPKAEARIRSGLCDIPGTRASVRVDPRARLIVVS